MPKSQLARIYRFLPRGKRKLKLRFLLREASRPSRRAPRRSAHHRAECGASRRGGDQRVRVRRAPCKLIRGWNKYYTALASASHCCLRCCRLRLQRELPMKVSPNERREGERGRRKRKRWEGRRDRRGGKIESKARVGTRNMENLPRRVSPKSDAFFQFSCRGVATFPPQPTLYSSRSQVFWSFEQAGALLFLPILVILLPRSLFRRPSPSPSSSRRSPSFLPSFLYVLPPSLISRVFPHR